MVQKDSTFTIHGVGRRKSSVARVWMKRGTGNIVVNDKAFQDYFTTKIEQDGVVFPFRACGKEKSFDVKVSVQGGGLIGQANAVRLGIARALLASDAALRPALKGFKLLTVDSRLKERKKYGQKGARKKFQFVKR